MDDTIVISDDDEPLVAQRLTENRYYDFYLTGNHCALENLPELDSSVIDLTANEDEGFPELSPVLSLYKAGFTKSEGEHMNLQSNNSSEAISENEGTSECIWQTDINSTTSIESCVLQNYVSTSRKQECLTDEATKNDMCLTPETNSKEPSDTALTLKGWSLPIFASGESGSNYTSRLPNVNCQPPCDTSSISSVTAEECNTRSSSINKALLYKLRCFKKAPVSHFFHRLENLGKSRPAKPIPQSRMSIVNHTREEGIHQSTLHFLSEFVTAEHYPPRDIVMHIIQSVLLGAEEQAIKHEAYMVLMKVQKLHPASVNTVVWNWSLLSEVMERKENHTFHLFLQYVVQTLDDDYEFHLKRRSLPKSLCKTVLSCDKANIKNVIAWLIHAVENACDIAVNKELDTRSLCQQRVVCLLQRMLSIAVEVDNLPVTNSNRIADLLFPYVIVLKTRRHRELFFSSTENHLLRAKILELIFLNSCKSVPPQDQPLSLYKILHFIGYSTLLLENQGPEWQRWDEILHHICLLFFSLQRIIADHLRVPLRERLDKIPQGPQMQLSFREDVTEADVEQYLSLFWRRTALRSDVPGNLQNRFNMLKSLLLTAVKTDPMNVSSFV